MVIFLQNLINALQWGSFYALIALGYSMVYSILMLFNFAHGDIFMVGAYIGFGVAMGLTALSSTGVLHLPNWLILVLTILLSMFLTSFVGMIVERVGYRPLRNAPRASAAITGLMIGIILETGNLALLGARRVTFPALIETQTYELGGVVLTNKKIMIVLVSRLLSLALHQFVRRTKWGMAMRAMAFDFAVGAPDGGAPEQNGGADVRDRLRACRRSGHSLRDRLPGARSLHGDRVRLEGVRGGHPGGEGIHPRCDPGRLPPRIHRDLRGHDLPVHPAGSHRLFDHPSHPRVQASRLLR